MNSYFTSWEHCQHVGFLLSRDPFLDQCFQAPYTFHNFQHHWFSINKTKYLLRLNIMLQFSQRYFRKAALLVVWNFNLNNKVSKKMYQHQLTNKINNIATQLGSNWLRSAEYLVILKIKELIAKELTKPKPSPKNKIFSTLLEAEHSAHSYYKLSFAGSNLSVGQIL